MDVLIKETPLQMLPSHVMQVGLNAAILLQQLQFNLLISTHVRDGHKWVYKSYEEWKNEEFPFWSVATSDGATCAIDDRIISSRGSAKCPLYKGQLAPSNNLKD